MFDFNFFFFKYRTPGHLVFFNTLTRVPNRFFGIRDLAYFKAGIRDFEGKGGRDSRLQLLPGHGIWRF